MVVPTGINIADLRRLVGNLVHLPDDTPITVQGLNGHLGSVIDVAHDEQSVFLTIDYSMPEE